jgi:hypothetical protein
MKNKCPGCCFCLPDERGLEGDGNMMFTDTEEHCRICNEVHLPFILCPSLDIKFTSSPSDSLARRAYLGFSDDEETYPTED